MATPGRSRRARAMAASASARLWRRRMRFSTRSDPDCSDRCKCGMKRGSLASRSHSASSIAAGSSEDSRSRGSSGTARSTRGRPARRCPARAVAGDVDAGQHHLPHAGGDQGAHLRHHRGRRHAAVGAAAERDGAEGAAVVAAGLHLHEAAGVGGEPRRRRWAACSPGADAAAGAGRPGRGAQLVGIAQHPAHAGQRRPARPGRAAPRSRSRRSRAGPVARRRADGLARLPLRLRRDGAGVDHRRVAPPVAAGRGSPRSRPGSGGSRRDRIVSAPIRARLIGVGRRAAATLVAFGRERHLDAVGRAAGVQRQSSRQARPSRPSRTSALGSPV